MFEAGGIVQKTFIKLPPLPGRLYRSIKLTALFPELLCVGGVRNGDPFCNCNVFQMNL